jgi:hypothetical protein
MFPGTVAGIQSAQNATAVSPEPESLICQSFPLNDNICALLLSVQNKQDKMFNKISLNRRSFLLSMSIV